MVEDSHSAEVAEEIMARIQDPLYLPTRAEVEACFAFRPTMQSLWIDNRLTDFHLYLGEVYGKPLYEFPTKEYIYGLGSYIGNRIHELRGSIENPTPILEVAAGSGRLTYFLRRQLTQIIPNIFQIVATDNFSYPDSRFNIGTQVEELGYEEALNKYRPAIVIGSWLPSPSDAARYCPSALEMTQRIRQTPSVQELILIGDPDAHAPDDAFGYEMDVQNRRVRQKIPSYIQDGFIRSNLSYLRPQYSYYDRNSIHLSQTIAFSRIR